MVLGPIGIPTARCWPRGNTAAANGTAYGLPTLPHTADSVGRPAGSSRSIATACSSGRRSDVDWPRRAVVVEEFSDGEKIKVTRWDENQKHVLLEAQCEGKNLHGRLTRSYPPAPIEPGEHRPALSSLVLQEDLYFKNGVRHGLAQGWYQDGAKCYAGTFEAGLEHGRWTWWDPEGAIEFDAEFRHGQLQLPGGGEFPRPRPQGLTSADTAQQIRRSLDLDVHGQFREQPLADVLSYFAEPLQVPD